MKQNWLLMGLCTGSMVLAITGWTRKVDCACPKAMNATIASTIKPTATWGPHQVQGVPTGTLPQTLPHKPATVIASPRLAPPAAAQHPVAAQPPAKPASPSIAKPQANTPLDTSSGGAAPTPQSPPPAARNPSGRTRSAMPASTTTSSSTGGTTTVAQEAFGPRDTSAPTQATPTDGFGPLNPKATPNTPRPPPPPPQ